MKTAPWTVRALAERVPALPSDASMTAILAACLADDEHDWVVLVDGRDRPVRLVERAAMLLGAPASTPSTGSPPSARSTRRCGAWACARSCSRTRTAATRASSGRSGC
jgi:hypothetical protein